VPTGIPPAEVQTAHRSAGTSEAGRLDAGRRQYYGSIDEGEEYEEEEDLPGHPKRVPYSLSSGMGPTASDNYGRGLVWKDDRSLALEHSESTAEKYRTQSVAGWPAPQSRNEVPPKPLARVAEASPQLPSSTTSPGTIPYGLPGAYATPAMGASRSPELCAPAGFAQGQGQNFEQIMAAHAGRGQGTSPSAVLNDDGGVFAGGAPRGAIQPQPHHPGNPESGAQTPPPRDRVEEVQSPEDRKNEAMVSVLQSLASAVTDLRQAPLPSENISLQQPKGQEFFSDELGPQSHPADSHR
jgi:hypothetical protein